MKKTLLILCALLVTMGMNAQSKKKSIVVYFSASGTTEEVAKQLADVAGADLFEIVPAKKYTSADLNWNDKKSRSTVEMNDEKARPQMKENIKNLAQYETIYIGFPIWWGVAPRIINTFLEANNLKGKTLVPFATSGGSSIEKATSALKKSYPNLTWKQGKLLNHPSKSDLQKFIGK